MHYETGAMPVILWKCNGECCSRTSQKDFVIATGRQKSVRQFVELSANALGWGRLDWDGEGLDEVGRRTDTGAVVVKLIHGISVQRK